jgi:WD40 repeat protein
MNSHSAALTMPFTRADDARASLGPPDHKTWVLAVAFSPDGKRVLTGSDDNAARLWDAATGEAVATLKGALALDTRMAGACRDRTAPRLVGPERELANCGSTIRAQG